MSEAVIEGDPTQRGGHALIRIVGGAAGVADPRFRLSRDGYEAGTLGPAGWQVADVLLTPLAARAEAADLVLGVGPAVVDQLESGVVMLAVPSAGFDEPVFWPELALSRGGQGSAGIAVPPTVQARPQPLEGKQKLEPPVGKPVVVRPEPVPPPPPVIVAPPEPSPPRNLMPLIVAGVLLVAAAGGGAWWAMHRTEPQIALPAPVPTTPAPAPAPVADCSHGSVAETVACAPDADALYAVAQKRWDAGQADQGLVLMQIASDRGSGNAALKLAQLYDPNRFQPGGPISQANPRQAAQYYRKAVAAHQEAAIPAREALHKRLQADAENGDPLAGLTLKDFWP